ncbi:MAG: hypothetical protein AAF612_04245 [Planctomycetota bacterium]
MSEKYKRVKQADLALPAPLRWLTRAFSSIRMAVVLLTLVALYGLVASVPLPLIAAGASYLLIGAGWIAVAAVFWWALARAVIPDAPPSAKATGYAIAGVGAVSAAVFTSIGFHQNVLTAQPWWTTYRATTFYRLPGIEMTELEFYSAWPMKLLLALFVCNMVWATVRRIAFNLPNLGVLTVHTGIVVTAVGSIAYSSLKLEGDMLLPRADLDPTGQQGFRRYVYDRNDPALYVSVDGAPAGVQMFPLAGKLPRYNDYTPDQLAIPISEERGFKQSFGDQLRVTIEGFYSYAHAEMELDLVSASQQDAYQPGDGAPGLVVAIGPKSGPAPQRKHALRAARPDEQGFIEDGLLVEMPLQVPPRRQAELLAELPRGGPLTGLVVQGPEASTPPATQPTPQAPATPPATTPEPWVSPAIPGDALVAQTPNGPLRIRVLSIGDYPFPFSTPGYERAQDVCALLHISDDRGYEAIRFAMHRFPELGQDFVYDPESPAATPEPPDFAAIEPGPLPQRLAALQGLQRKDADPRFRIALLDDRLLQYRLAPLDPQLTRFALFMRGRGLPAMNQPIAFSDNHAQRQLPLGSTEDGAPWLHLVKAVPDAVPVMRPVPVDKENRKPREEGTHLHAVLPVAVQRVNPATGETLFSQKVHLRHYLYADDYRLPSSLVSPHVDVPGVGRVNLTFSRVRYPLDFFVRLTDFEREVFPGSDDARDFIASLQVVERQPGQRTLAAPVELTARMNNPAHFNPNAFAWPFYLGSAKLSQNQWDPGDPALAPAEKSRRDPQGRLVNQQRWSVVGVSNNIAIHVIAAGLTLVLLGIPWAFYVKPWMMKRQSRNAAARKTPSANAPAPQEPKDPDKPRTPAAPAPTPQPEPATV